MLMWLTGFLVVPIAREWSGIPFLLIGCALLSVWIRAYAPSRDRSPRRAELQRWIGGVAAEEAVVGAVSGPLAGVHQAWNFSIGIPAPFWVPWLALLVGAALLALAQREAMPLEWLLPVRGRWRRLTLATLGMVSLHVAGPCWVFLLLLWGLEDVGPTGPQLLTARLASGLLAAVVLLYSAGFVQRFGRRTDGTAASHPESPLSPQTS